MSVEPGAAVPAVPRQAAGGPERRFEPHAVRRGPLRVLLVEDSAGDVEIVRELLRTPERAAGVELLTTFRLDEALALLARAPVHAVLLDLSLPDSQGLCTLESVRRAFPDTPVVVLTGLDDELIALEAVARGAQDYLLKHSLVEGVDLDRVLRYAIERQAAEETLRRSEARHRTLFETMALGVVYQRADGVITAANPAACRILGLTVDEVRGRASTDPEWRALGEDGTPLPGEEHAPTVALRTGRPVLRQLMGVFNPVERRTRWIQVDAVPQLRPGEDRPYEVHTSFVDVTEQRAAVERIRALNRLLRITSEIDQMIVRERDPRRVLEETCRIAVEHGGFSGACAAEVGPGPQMACANVCSAGCGGAPEVRPGSACRADERGPLALAIREARPILVADVATDERFPVWGPEAAARGFRQAAALPVRAHGRPVASLMVCAGAGHELDAEVEARLSEIAADVGFALETIANQRARQLAEEQLRQSERRYRLLFERNLAGVYRAGLDGTLIECNDAFARALGHPERASLLGRSLSASYPGLEDWAAFAEALLRQGEVHTRESVRLRADGATVHLLESAATVEGDDGRTWIEGSAIDISGHKRVEEQLRQAQKLEAVGRLAGGVAHDFNNLLQAGLGLSELLRGEAPALPGVVAAADELRALFERGAALTRQLLLFARRETAHPMPVDLNEILRGISKLLGRLIKENVAIQLDLAEKPLPLVADRGQIEQVLVNLTVNSVDAMTDGGRIVLRTGALGGARVFVEVEDDGGGIPEEIRERVFEPFFTTKETGHGTGLGLAVVHGIVTAHGGSIELSSQIGRGSTFRVVLPAGEPAAPVAIQRGGSASPRRGRGERLLVVEDQPAVRTMLARMLERLGYRVVVAASAEEALALPPSSPFDLLLSDVVLPGLRGTALSHQLRARWPGLAVILMSGYSEDRGLDAEIAEGRVRFLAKPFSIEAVAAAVADCLAGSPPA